MNNQQVNTTEASMMVIVFFIFLMLMIPIMAKAMRPYYNQFIITSSKVLLIPLSFSGEVMELRVALKGIDAKTMEPDQVTKVLQYVGSWYRWLFAPILIFLLIKAWRNNLGEKYKRLLNMWSLVLNNSIDFPCLAPIVKTGPITKQQNNEGPWALARSPIQFVAETNCLLDEKGKSYNKNDLLTSHCLGRSDSHALLKNNSLDLDCLKGLFVQQLGQKFDGDIMSLPPHQLGLASALIAHGSDNKVLAFKIFNQLSLSWDPKSCTVDINGITPNLEAIQNVKELSIHQTYVNVWFMALLKWSRRKGALPSSLWIWLRPTDRTLFYALNQVGGRTAWTEASGPWSHYIKECENKKSFPEPQIEYAIAGLIGQLSVENWVINKNAQNTSNTSNTPAPQFISPPLIDDDLLAAMIDQALDDDYFDME